VPKLVAFRDAASFRAWLEAHHATERELLVRCYKTAFRHEGLTYREVLDEALCFGWIDGVRRSVDGESFSQRFTPRRPKSYWSAVNTRRARELIAAGRMRPPGLAAFRARDASARGRYSFEAPPGELAPALLARLRKSARAWAYFQAQPPWYRRTTARWVMSAKQEETRLRRLALLIRCSEERRAVPPLARPARRGAKAR
jgi:uncharacterized protein YdeI (YjbR/CyaY-like superfamily)